MENNANQWEMMEIKGSSMGIDGNQSKSAETNGKQRENQKIT